MYYKHSSIEEREKIQEMLWQKASVRNIAKAIGRDSSSVSREIKKNKPPKNKLYTPRLAHERALKYRKRRGREERLKNPILREYVITHLKYVITHLKLGWSPEQIAGTAKKAAGTSISHEAIYQYVYAQIHRDGYGYLKPGKEDLRPYLARRRKRRMGKGFRRVCRLENGPLPSIDDRPEIFGQVGHWEDDSVIFTPTCPVGLRTMNERASGLVLISKARKHTMEEANRLTLKRLVNIPQEFRKTLTRDRGTENLGYRELEQALGIRCFFAHAYHFWERGSNENINGLIRRFLPKKTDFRTISDDQIATIEHLLNSRPRKRLGWKTPYEVFYELTGVALQG